MKSTKAKLQYWWLIPVGLMINSGALLLGQYLHMSDFARGGLQGIGIGVMLTVLIKNRKMMKRVA